MQLFVVQLLLIYILFTHIHSSLSLSCFISFHGIRPVNHHLSWRYLDGFSAYEALKMNEHLDTKFMVNVFRSWHGNDQHSIIIITIDVKLYVVYPIMYRLLYKRSIVRSISVKVQWHRFILIFCSQFYDAHFCLSLAWWLATQSLSKNLKMIMKCDAARSMCANKLRFDNDCLFCSFCCCFFASYCLRQTIEPRLSRL